MARFGFVSGSYTSQSPNADDERCANWYPERLEQQGKSNFALYPTPGLRLAINLPTEIGGVVNAPIRDQIHSPRGLFAITGDPAVGGKFYEVRLTNGAYTSIQRGVFSAAGGTQPYTQMVYGGGLTGNTVWMLVDGEPYYWDGVTFANIPAVPTFGTSVSQVGYCGGFFLALAGNKIFASAPLDVTTWPGASSTIPSIFPDTTQSLVVNQTQVWLLSLVTGAVYYLSGNSPFPFDYIEGSFIEHGICANASMTKLDNSIFWLGEDPQGQAMVWRASGYTPQRVSTHAIEFAIQGYRRIPLGGTDRFNNGINDAIGYAYQDQGHSFYVLYFPSANSGNGATWVYDIATQMWHERFFLNNGVEQAHRSRNHSFFIPFDFGTQSVNPGRHIVGDWQATGNLYEMQIPAANGTGGWDFADDFGNKIQRVRRSPHINLEKEWVFHNEITIDLESGLGPMPPSTLLPFAAITDNFNRANAPLSAPWVPFITAPQIVGNAVQPLNVFPGNPSFAYYSGPIWPDDQYSKCTVVTLTGGVNSTIALVARFSTDGVTESWYEGAFTSLPGPFYFLGILHFQRDVATGTLTANTLNSSTVLIPPTPGDILEFDAIEGRDCISALTMKINGVTVLSASDGNLQSGAPGFGLGASVAVANASIDNWEAGTFAENLEPQVMLRWSDDGGHRWSNEYLMGAGQAGQYNKRVVRRRLGKSRQRIYEIKCSDAIPWRIADAYLKATPAYSPEERLISRAAKSA